MKVNWNGTCHIVVPDEKDMGNIVHENIVDMHSHGLKKLIGTELQYIINVRKTEYFQERVSLFYSIAEAVLKGSLKIEDGKVFTFDGWEDCKFKFFKAKDANKEDIFRVVECDMKGKFPEDKSCAFPFNLQYIDIDWLRSEEEW